MKLTDIKGLGKRKQEILSSMDIHTPLDLLYRFPLRFEDRRQPLDPFAGAKGSFRGRLISKEKWRSKGGRDSLKLHLAWKGFVIEALFFQAAYLDRYFRIGEDYLFYGELQRTGPRFSMIHPSYAGGDDKDFFSLIPIYGYRKGLSQKDFPNFVKQAFDGLQLEDPLTKEDVDNWKLMGYREALMEMHFPTSRQAYAQAKYRLIFNDFFFYLLARRGDERPKTKKIKSLPIEDFLAKLSFELTEDQRKTIEDMQDDFASGKQMQRLVQGDVGSGKSVHAYFGAWRMLQEKKQVAYMAPTELLARQQATSLDELFPGEVALLIGSTKNKDLLYSKIAQGEVKILVGTHALFEEVVEFKDLALVIIDEQQRFGVGQRSRLHQKGEDAHLLMLSATPIPRTLSMILHQNLDISYLKTKPPGRQEIRTKIVSPRKLDEVYEHIKREISEGRKAFVVFPLIEDSEVLQATSLEEGVKELKKIFGKKLGVVHGKMTSDEKEEALLAFKRGETSVLASTTVIEVGMDIPEATILLLQSAQRFGLSQIHQIRGRIGRNPYPSTCYLSVDGEVPERLHILEKYSDGFTIAEEDLRLRGPGELRGSAQSGSYDFIVADLVRHREILERVNSLLTEEVVKAYQQMQERIEL